MSALTHCLARARARSHSGARTQACSVTHPPRPTPGALEVLVKPTLVASACRSFLSHQELSDAFSKEFVAKMDEVTGKKGGKDRGWHEKGRACQGVGPGRAREALWRWRSSQ